MSYIINEKIVIARPIIFLCGPYYDEKNKSDRRKILKDYLLSEYNNKCMPLIIDDFLTKENIKDDTISIQLLEEIFAGIAYKTYIFLDTMSSAVELGLFSNSASNNSIYVMLPYEQDIYTSGVGYFSKEIVLKNDINKIKTVWYHPKIKRVAFSSDYVTEYYDFVDDKIPAHIIKDIQNHFTSIDEKKHKILVEQNEGLSENDFCINYKYSGADKSVKVFISIRLLFYLVAGIVHDEYAESLLKKDELDFNHYDVDMAIVNLKLCLLQYIRTQAFEAIDKAAKIEIDTILVYKVDTIIKHIVIFIFTYYKKSRLRGYYLVGKNHIVKPYNLNNNPIDILGLTFNDLLLIKEITDNPSNYLREFIIRRKSKKRNLVTYHDGSNGKELRLLHEKVLKGLQRNYSYHTNSYAYQKGKSIKGCVTVHKESEFFLKYDINKFFNSIDKSILLNILMDELHIDKKYMEHLRSIINICFWNEMLPLGLVTSPILSDMYLKHFDKMISDYVSKKGYVYTRYADDIMISSKEKLELVEVKEITDLISRELKRNKLTLNAKKQRNVQLRNVGQHIKYLGINIVKTEGNNDITLGKNLKNYVAKCFINYIQDTEDVDVQSYKRKRIIGYLSFIKMIEGEQGLQYIYKRIEKSTNGRVVVKRGIYI